MELCCIWDNMYILVLVISLLLFWLTYLYFVENYGYWEQLKIPHVQAVFPWGSMSDGLIFTKVHLAIACDEFYKQFEGKQYYGIMQVRSPCLVIRDPDLIQSILTIDSDSFRDRASVEYNYKEYMLKNIFTMRGDEWKIRRKKLMPAYNSAQIKIFCHLDTSTENLKNHMEEMVQRSEEVDVEDLVSPFILETVINCAFSADSENYPSEIAELRQTVPLLFQLDLSILQKLFMYNAFPVFKRIYWKKFDLVKPSIKELMTNLVCKIITNREENDLARYDFLELLIKLRQSKICIEKDEVPINKAGNDECLTNHEMAGEVFGFIYGSYQKPLSVMIFCLYQLSVNLLVQEQLCREVKEVMNKCSGVLQAQALEQMTYMDRVIKETMRMYPPMPILQRTCNQDYKVPNSDLVIKEDVKIIIPTYSLHHDPQHFPDPIRFIPDRFTDEYASERHPFVFLPLGAGPRNCVGEHFAMMQVKAGLATIIHDYEISLSQNTKVPVELKSDSFILKNKHPIKLHLRRRDSY